MLEKPLAEEKKLLLEEVANFGLPVAGEVRRYPAKEGRYSSAWLVEALWKGALLDGLAATRMAKSLMTETAAGGAKTEAKTPQAPRAPMAKTWETNPLLVRCPGSVDLMTAWAGLCSIKEGEDDEEEEEDVAKSDVVSAIKLRSGSSSLADCGSWWLLVCLTSMVVLLLSKPS